MVCADSVLGAETELAASGDDADVDKSLSYSRVQVRVLHAIKSNNTQPQADLVRHHHTDQSHPLPLTINNYLTPPRILTCSELKGHWRCFSFWLRVLD